MLRMAVLFDIQPFAIYDPCERWAKRWGVGFKVSEHWSFSYFAKVWAASLLTPIQEPSVGICLERSTSLPKEERATKGS
jgi:hypothetical protein